MSISFEIPDQLVERLRTLAHERGVSVEELSQQALTVGLAQLTAVPGVTPDGMRLHGSQPDPGAHVAWRSPLVTSGLPQRRMITLEAATEGTDHAH